MVDGAAVVVVVVYGIVPSVVTDRCFEIIVRTVLMRTKLPLESFWPVEGLTLSSTSRML
jgi:hypothetical protein